MIRNLLASTAIATLLTTGAYAQVDPAPDAGMDPGMGADVQNVIHAEGLLAANVIGETVYNSTADDADNIGNVNDIIITEDGDAVAVVIGVGGFLGLGQKDVGIAFEATQWHERDGDRVLVLETTAEQLEALPEFDRRAYEPQPADAEIGNTQWATAEDLGITTATTADDAADEPAADAVDVDPDADEPADDATGEDELDTYDPQVDEDAVVDDPTGDDAATDDDPATDDATNGGDAATDESFEDVDDAGDTSTDTDNGSTADDATNGDDATTDTPDATTNGDDAATDTSDDGSNGGNGTTDTSDDTTNGDTSNGDDAATDDETIIEDDING